MSVAFFLIQAAARNMVKHGGGSIFNVCHLPGVQRPSSDNPSTRYSVGSAGLYWMTRPMAAELKPYHINVNAAALGEPPMSIDPAHSPGNPWWESLADAVEDVFSDSAKTGMQFRICESGQSDRLVQDPWTLAG